MKNYCTLLVLLTLIVSRPAVAASGCLQEARDAKKQSVSHLVVSFEGLASYFAGFVRRSLIRDLQEKYEGEFISKNYSYTSSVSAAQCAKDWYGVFGDQAVITVIGHSFGGGIAVFEMLKRLPNVPVNHVVTLDPRSWTTDSLYSKNKNLAPFTLPTNVLEGWNFYQRGAMPGYEVRGAKNFRLSGVSHVRVPAHPEVLRAVSCQIFADCD
jgi:hypothetical protein